MPPPLSTSDSQSATGCRICFLSDKEEVTAPATPLLPATAYAFRVRAGNAAGWGNWSTAGVCPPPLSQPLFFPPSKTHLGPENLFRHLLHVKVPYSPAAAWDGGIQN